MLDKEFAMLADGSQSNFFAHVYSVNVSETKEYKRFFYVFLQRTIYTYQIKKTIAFSVAQASVAFNSSDKPTKYLLRGVLCRE